jgi:serine phosphatase RsbU (regulator of sigma subunit)
MAGEDLKPRTPARGRRRPGQGGAFFGHDGLVAAVRDLAQSPSLAAIGQEVARRARAFAGGGPQRDDVCLLLARRRDPHG